MGLWDLRKDGALDRLADVATRDGREAVHAHWKREHYDRHGKLVSGRWSSRMPSDFTQWANELTEDFIQSSIGIPREMQQALRTAYEARDDEAVAQARAKVQEYVILQQTARKVYFKECLKAIWQAFSDLVHSYYQLPRRTLPPASQPTRRATNAPQLSSQRHGDAS